MSRQAALEARLRQAIARHGKFIFARSGGPGGQNVNAVSTQVEVRVPVDALPVSAAKRALINQRLATRITQDGWIRVVSRKERHQRMNRERAIDTLIALLIGAMHEDPRRVPTKPSKGALNRRRTTREKTSQRKQSRRRPEIED